MHQPLAWRREACLGLDGVESGDTLDRLLGNRRFLAVPDIEELASAMRPARDLGDRPVGAAVAFGGALIIQRLEPGIAIRLQEATEVRQVPRRMFAAAIGAVEVDGRRRRGATEGPIVPHIHPEPPGLGPAETGRQHRRVVAVDLLGREHVPPDPLDDRLQQPGRLADPLAQGRTIEIDAVPRIDLALPADVVAKPSGVRFSRVTPSRFSSSVIRRPTVT